ncbi:hypothetical protein G7Y89_g4548 [Cudoniella acicularis]|uniref:NAD(P)-binding domain-containing protein n=1 Tax=Cudoniella acicularis TaxID=354080 RepID=A0A8H4W4L0_9HELO|nr:hypothetical protein G7Y89_g4548 [Cudoniella acicularis]
MTERHHILLLGGTGICGLIFTQAALEAGHKLTLYVRTPSKIPTELLSNANLSIIQGDLGDVDGLKKAASCGADVFISLAGPTLGKREGTPITSALKTLYPLLLENGTTKRVMILSTASYSAPEDTRSFKWWVAINCYIKIIGGDTYEEITGVAQETVALGEKIPWTVFRVPLLNGTKLGENDGEVHASFVGDSKGRDRLNLDRGRLAHWILNELFPLQFLFNFQSRNLLSSPWFLKTNILRNDLPTHHTKVLCGALHRRHAAASSQAFAFIYPSPASTSLTVQDGDKLVVSWTADFSSSTSNMALNCGQNATFSNGQATEIGVQTWTNVSTSLTYNVAYNAKDGENEYCRVCAGAGGQYCSGIFHIVPASTGHTSTTHGANGTSSSSPSSTATPSNATTLLDRSPVLLRRQALLRLRSLQVRGVLRHIWVVSSC